MVTPTIEMPRNSATGTRTSKSRFRSPLFESEETANRLSDYPCGSSQEPSGIPSMLEGSLFGMSSWIEHQGKQSATDDSTTERNTSALASGLARIMRLASPIVHSSSAVYAIVSTPSLRDRSFIDHYMQQDQPVADVETDKIEEDLEIIDWDVHIDQLPPRHSETVVVKFTEGSYRPPRIVDNPED